MHAAFLLAVLLTATASGQVPADSVDTGSISGSVTDASTGEPLIGATVWLVDTEYGAATDIEGRYACVEVPPGVYEVQVSYIGFQRVTVASVTIEAGKTATIDAALQPSDDLTLCFVCSAPIAPRGPFFARVVTYERIPDGCYAVEPGDTFTRDS